MHAQLPRYETRIPAVRTLERDFRHLAQLLRPGLSVLDIGCANGALTAGIARRVGPGAEVIGMDTDPLKLEAARSLYSKLTNLKFEVGDALNLPYEGRFDVITAARILQWIPDSARVIQGMKRAAKSHGMLAVHDFNHANHNWSPDPPAAYRTFYTAFLAWRHANGWNNKMAEHLPGLFEAAGLTDVESHVYDEIVERGDLEFLQRAELWSDAIDNMGMYVVKAGLLTRTQLLDASEAYASYIRTGLMKQTLQMRTVTGIVP